jgi:hypothetical protein
VRNSYGNKAAAITPDQVKAVREKNKGQTGILQVEQLLKDHPLEK